MRLTEVVDDAPSLAGYKFDLFNSEKMEVVKVFATREAVVQAVAMAGSDRPFDAILIEAANVKFDLQKLEPDGLILLTASDLGPVAAHGTQ